MILELAHIISVIWPNQLQNRSQRNAHARVYTNKICRVINQWNWGGRSDTCCPAPIVQIALWSTWPDEAKTIKPITNEAFVASSGDIITDYNDLYCLFTRRKLEKWQTTSTTLHCSKLAFESSVAETYLQAASQKSDGPCKVGIAPLYRNSLCANLQARLLSCQVQEIVLRKLRRTHSNIWVELFWNSVVNTT